MAYAKKIIPFPRKEEPARRNEHELAFLPAALEIVETPPSPIGRAIGMTIIALFCIALVWASISTVDIVATATGKIIPSGRVKVIQPFQTGVVRAIHVHDGQAVKAGDVLIDLDPTMNEAELDRLKGDLISAELDAARLRAAASGSADPLRDFHPPANASPALVKTTRQYLLSQTTEQRAKLAALDRQISQKRADRAAIAATVAKIGATIPLLSQRVALRKYLYDKELTSKLQYLTDEQDLVGLQHELLVEKSRYKEADAGVSALIETRAQTVAAYRRTLFDDLNKAEEKAASFKQQVIRAEQLAKLQVLTAPVDGVVQQLAVHTIGGVVTPAQPLLMVVPRDSHLEIEAMVSNRDIGFVHPGQQAEIKVDTFNFTRYGLLHGRVLTVSPDAITPDRTVGSSNAASANAGNPSGALSGQELNYMVRVSLDRERMVVNGKQVNLSPGMAVTVEIKTGSRRIISYLLSPLIEYKHEVFRER